MLGLYCCKINWIVVAGESVVTKEVAAYTMVGGVPARKIRDRFEK